MTGDPLIHSRYTVWTLVGSSLVVLAAVVRVLAGASAALLVTAVGVVTLVAALGTSGATSRWTGALAELAPNDADVAEEG